MRVPEPEERPSAPQAPPVPAAARGAFPRDRLHLAENYAASLAGDGVTRGLIGPREVPRLWERHLLNCASVAELVPPTASVADVGSGAGLPGLVLAIARPDLQVTLIEPLLRRVTYLEEVVTHLDLRNVAVMRSRAEDAMRSLPGPGFDVVTSRAVARLPKLVTWCMPLVAADGALLAMKGAAAGAEAAEARETLDRLGAGVAEVLQVGTGTFTTSVVRVAWADPSRVSWHATAGSVSRPGSVPKRRRGRRRHEHR